MKNSTSKAKIFFSFICIFSVNSFAATGKVTKVKGNQAIVEFSTPVKVGEKVNTGLKKSSFDSDEDSSTHPGDRKYALSYTWSSIINQSSTNQTTTHSGQATFWWNLGSLAFGPILAIESSSSTTFGVGGIGQYNFITNQSGEAWIPGVYLKGYYQSTSTSAASSNLTLYGLGGSLDWFPLGDHVALNASLEYVSRSYSSGTSNSYISLGSGLKAYF